MNTWPVIVGLVVVAALALIPIVLVGRIALGIIVSVKEHRHVEARKVTAVVRGLGEFWTTDNRWWFGQARGLQVSLESVKGPPQRGSGEGSGAGAGSTAIAGGSRKRSPGWTRGTFLAQP